MHEYVFWGAHSLGLFPLIFYFLLLNSAYFFRFLWLVLSPALHLHCTAQKNFPSSSLNMSVFFNLASHSAHHLSHSFAALPVGRFHEFILCNISKKYFVIIGTFTHNAHFCWAKLTHRLHLSTPPPLWKWLIAMAKQKCVYLYHVLRNLKRLILCKNLQSIYNFGIFNQRFPTTEQMPALVFD
jgi:hypothetical protein